jgi:non-ribosomal peptide synthetase component F
MWDSLPFDGSGGCGAEVVVARTTLGWVAHAREVFCPLSAGVPIVIATATEAGDPRLLAQLIERVGATRVRLVPSLLAPLLADMASGKACPKLPSLRVVMVSGEALSPELANRFHQVFNPHAGEPQCQIINLWGCTECIACSMGEFKPRASVVTIGRPLPNVALHVLDDATLRPAPPGEVGTIYAGGLAISNGKR